MRRDGMIESVNDLSHPLLAESIRDGDYKVDLIDAFVDGAVAETLQKHQNTAMESGLEENTDEICLDDVTTVNIRSQLLTTHGGNDFVFHHLKHIHETNNTAKTKPVSNTKPASANGIGEKRIELLKALHDITVRLMDQQPMQELLQNVADSILELTAADSSYINLASPDGKYLELVAVAGDNRTSIGYKTYRGVGLSGKTLESGKLEYSSNYNKIRNRIKAFDTAKQACALPLKNGNKIVGVLGFIMEAEAESLFTQIDIVQQFATLTSIAINNSMLMEETREELKRTQSMNILSSAVLENDSFDDLLKITMRTIMHVAKAVDVEAWSLKDGKNIHCIDTIEGLRSDLHDELDRTRQALSQWLNNEHSADGQNYLFFSDESDEKTSSTDCIFMPCMIDDHADILFRVSHPNVRYLSQSVQQLLAGIAKQFSTAISRQNLQRKVEHLAFHDGLTSLPNRVKFDGLLKRAIENGTENQEEFSILFIDLDGFKKVNDTHGHDLGDAFLKDVANRFGNVMDEHSVLARVGGDEFAAIIKQENNQATEIAQEVLDSLDADLRLEYGIPEIGASIGISHFPIDGTSSHQLLRKADMAMYHSKRNGKNQATAYREIEHDLNTTTEHSTLRKIA